MDGVWTDHGWSEQGPWTESGRIMDGVRTDHGWS